VNIDRTAGVIVFVSLVIDALSYHPPRLQWRVG